MLSEMHSEERLTPGFSTLDVGCGNGLLGITAALLGAGNVRGIDLLLRSHRCSQD